MTFRMGDRVVPTERARETLYPNPRGNHRYPTVGKTVGTITKLPSGGQYYGVIWDKDDGGEFPPGEFIQGHQYTNAQLEWLLAADEMEKHVPTTPTTTPASTQADIDAFKAKARLVAARAKRSHPGKADSIDEILKFALIEGGPDRKAELPRGSVVRHPSMSIVYARPWSAYTDGGSNWYSTSSSQTVGVDWNEVLRLTGGDPVVLVDMRRDQDYDDADARHGHKKLTELEPLERLA